MKLYVLHSYWDYYWLHWGDVSKEHGELSPQDTEVKKKRQHRVRNAAVMEDFV